MPRSMTRESELSNADNLRNAGLITAAVMAIWGSGNNGRKRIQAGKFIAARNQVDSLNQK